MDSVGKCKPANADLFCGNTRSAFAGWSLERFGGKREFVPRDQGFPFFFLNYFYQQDATERKLRRRRCGTKIVNAEE